MKQSFTWSEPNSHTSSSLQINIQLQRNTEVGRIATNSIIMHMQSIRSEMSRLESRIALAICLIGCQMLIFEFKITNFQAIIGLIGCVWRCITRQIAISFTHSLQIHSVCTFKQMFTVHAMSVICPSHQSRKLSSLASNPKWGWHTKWSFVALLIGSTLSIHAFELN